MIKSVFLAKCKEQKINIPFRMIIDIYKDEDDIPDELLRILYEPREPKEYTLHMGEKLFNEFNRLSKEYFNKEKSNE